MKMRRWENNKIVEEEEEEGNKNEKGERYLKRCAQCKKKEWLAFFDYLNRIFNLIFVQLF